jgi:pantoate kinase
MSAAGALATALAVTSATGAARQRAPEIAHLADLYGGGGLGGVSAILAGGMEIRVRPGIPPWGLVRHHSATGTVFVAVAGTAMPSPALLRNPQFLRRVQNAAGSGLTRLRRRPTLSNFLAAAEQFTDTLRLGPPEVVRRVHALRAPDVAVAQAMFGRSLFAVPRTKRARDTLVGQLILSGLHAAEVGIARRGARVVPAPPAPHEGHEPTDRYGGLRA